MLIIGLKYNEYVHHVHTYRRVVLDEYGIIYEGRNSETKRHYSLEIFFCWRKQNKNERKITLQTIC